MHQGPARLHEVLQAYDWPRYVQSKGVFSGQFLMTLGNTYYVANRVTPFNAGPF